MNGINAVLAPTAPTTTAAAASTGQSTTAGATITTVRGNGSPANGHHHHHHHNTPTAAVTPSNEGYTQLTGQGSSSSNSSSSASSSSAVSSSSESEHDLRQSTRLTFPRREDEEEEEETLWSPYSSKVDFGAPSSGVAAGGTTKSFPSVVVGDNQQSDCKYSNRLSSEESNTSSSSLNLSNPNITAAQYSSDDYDAQFLYTVQSLEHDLDCILENRDLNPFFEDPMGMGASGGSKEDGMFAEAEGAECEFNVEDYLVDLDQYLEEQEKKSESNPGDQRIILRQPNTNRTLPRNHLRQAESTTALKRDAAIRNSMHLGREPTDGTSAKLPRRSLWLRNSMRKTKLIPLPNQESGSPIKRRSSSSSSSRGEGSSLVPSRSSSPPPVQTQSLIRVATEEERPPTMADFMSFNRITFNPSVPQQRPVNPIHEERLRNSEPPPPPPSVVREVPIVRTDVQFGYLNEQQLPSSAVPAFDHFVTQTPPATMPRQLGRRSDQSPRIIAINAESNTIIVGHNDDRPTIAPARVGLVQRGETTMEQSRSEDVRRSVRDNGNRRGGGQFDSMSSVASSRNPSPVSLISSSGSSMTSAQNDTQERTETTAVPETITRRNSSAQNETHRATVTSSTGSRRNSDYSQEDPEMKSKLWPHDLGSALAIISCTLGVFNMSRFAVFSVHFGANFIVQFLVLSVIFGIPMLWLQMCLGAKIKRGPAAMWKISPISRGIGIVLLLVQGLIGLYSAISISWLLVYFRDAFVANAERYKWEETVDMYRPGGGTNETITLAQTVADYFNGVVLQRYSLGHAGRVGFSSIGKVRFQLAFNLSLFWTFVFIILCRGLRSYGKIVFPLTILPVIGLTAFTTKLLMMIDFSSIENLFPATDWDDFFVNSHSWMTAAQETFLTWGLFGASVLSMSSNGMKKKGALVTLRRDAFFVVIITVYGLILAGVIGNACVQIIKDNGYLYYPGSYETLSSNVFLYPVSQPIPTNVISVPTKYLPRFSTILGEAMKQPGVPYHKESGYQVLRLVTELIPSAVAAATQEVISPWWCLLGITSLVMLAVAQFCAIWRPISTILGSNPSSVLLSCVTGLLLGIPLSTETGLQIVYFLEMTIGGAWWVLIIWFGQLIALFLIRGRPYTGDLIIKDMRFGNTISTFIALSWNIIIPVGLMFLCVFQYQVSDMGKFLHWKGISYWPLWARKLGGIVQITILQIVPVTAVLQIYRFLSKGPPDILDRVQLLYRPDIEARNRQAAADRRRNAETAAASPSITTIPLEVPVTPIIPDDVPPKYTPPPSYTTATGARIAKMLRQSIRRSVRRIMGEPGNSRGHLSNLSDRLSGLNSGLGSRNLEDSCSSTTIMGPPSYASVNIDLSLNTLTALVPTLTPTVPGQSVYTLPNSSHHQIPIVGSDKSVHPATSPTTPTNSNCVPNFLRPQRYLHSNRSLSLSGCAEQLVARNSFRGTNAAHNHFFNRRIVDPPQSRSLENLVLNSAEIGQSSAMTMLEDHSSSEGVASGGGGQEELRREPTVEEQTAAGRGERNKSRHNSTSSVI